MNEQIKLGRTQVNVFKREVNEMTGREKITKIKSGVVLQNFGSFLRVFDTRPAKDGGDAHVNCEVFAVNSRNIWCEFLNELKKEDAVAVPVSF